MTKQKLLHYAIIIVGIIGLLSLFPDAFYRLRYYTYLSNFIVVLFYIYFIKREHYSQQLYRLKSGITIIILLTFIVYNILLLPKASPVDFWTIRNFSLHYIVPILTTIDWLIFDKNIEYKQFDPFYWAIFPLLYSITSFLLGYIFQLPIPNEKHSPYPYFFININSVGWNGLATYSSIITVAYIALGYVMISIKNIQKNQKRS